MHSNNNYAGKKDFPFEVRDVESNDNAKLLQDFRGERTGFIQVGEKKWFFPDKFRHDIANFHNFKVRPSDVWIVTFPKSGTTVTQEMIWLLLNNLDYEKASSKFLDERYPLLESNCLFHPEIVEELLQRNSGSEDKCKSIENLTESICDYLDRMKERRFIKTHLPFSLLPKNLLTAGCKVIYLARNPKDVAVSYYHHSRLIRIHDYKSDFPTFWNYFSKNLVLWAPYWDHILEAWEKRSEENLLFMFYENINKDLRKTVSNVQTFLGSNFTDDQLGSLEHHLKIENFRKNNSVNCSDWGSLGVLNQGEGSFVREGKSGKSTHYFNAHLNNEADEWIEQHLKYTNLKFPRI